MQKDNGTGMNAREKLLKGFFPGRLLILNPVYICKAPEKGGISQLFGHGQVCGTVDSLRWTVKFCHLFTGDRFIQLFYAVQLLSIPIKMSTFFGNSEHPFPEK